MHFFLISGASPEHTGTTWKQRWSFVQCSVHLRKKIVCQEKHKVSTVFTYSTGTYCIIGVQVV